MSEQKPIPEEAVKALQKAKIRLMTKPDTAFFCTVCFSLRHVWDWTIPTACTDGKAIRYNPDFFLKQSPDQQLGLMIHELFHVIWLHMVRLGNRDMAKWNVATDFCINLLITDRGFKLPKGGLLSEKYRGMSSEEIYELLPDPPEDTEIHFEPGDGEDAPDAEQLEKEIQDILVRARIQSQVAGDRPGTIPGEVELYIERLLKPKLPTAVLLRKFLYTTAKDDYSWSRPNRRYFPKHHLPSLHSEALDHIAVAVDASGSVSDEEFQRFVSEVGGIIKQMRPKRISLITFDTTVRQVDEVRTLQELVKIKFTGRGGTRIAPVLEWINTYNPKVTLIFSDGGFRFPDGITPRTSVCWLIHDNPHWQAPYGRVIHYSTTED